MVAVPAMRTRGDRCQGAVILFIMPYLNEIMILSLLPSHCTSSPGLATLDVGPTISSQP